MYLLTNVVIKYLEILTIIPDWTAFKCLLITFLLPSHKIFCARHMPYLTLPFVRDMFLAYGLFYAIHIILAIARIKKNIHGKDVRATRHPHDDEVLIKCACISISGFQNSL